MSARRPGEDAPPPAALLIDVVVTGDGAAAQMTVRPDPPGARPAPEAVAAAPARAAAALAAAGVVHGIDRAAVAAALAAPGERPVTVAAATPPVPPADAAIEAPAVARAVADPLFTVPAGAVLARRTPARPGADGTAVTGAPIPPPEPRVPDLAAGAGAEAREDADGTLTIRAAVDGRPVMRGGTVGVEETVRCPELEAAGAPRDIHGTLVVAGDVGEGARITASGLVVVGGMVAHARIAAERGVAVTGSCVGTEIVAGAGGTARARIADALGPAVEELGTLVAEARQLIGSTSSAGRPVPGAAAVRVLLERRHPDLPAAWRAAHAAVAGNAAAAGLEPAVVAAVADLAERLGDARSGGSAAGPGALEEACRPVEAALAHIRAHATGPADVRAGYLQASSVTASGSLVITGAGTYNTDAVIGGDLLAEAEGATVRGGRLEVGGAVRVAELGAPGGARVEVVLTGARGAGEHLRAGVAHPGVEIVIGGRRIAVERRTLNLSVAGDDNSHVTRTGEIPEDERAPLQPAG